MGTLSSRLVSQSKASEAEVKGKRDREGDIEISRSLPTGRVMCEGALKRLFGSPASQNCERLR
jgi:hypothetical protein